MSGSPARVAIPRVASFKSAAAFQAHLSSLPIAMACDAALLPPERNPLAQPISSNGPLSRKRGSPVKSALKTLTL